MKVILIQDVPNLGKKYEVKEVKEGFAKNFLFPRKLAKPATPANLNWLERVRAKIEEKAEKDLLQAQEIAKSLDGREIEMKVKADDTGSLFSKITASKIAKHLQNLGFKVKKENIKLEGPISKLGEYRVVLNLEHGLEAEITLLVNPQEEKK